MTFAIIALIALIFIVSFFRILKEYERGVIFTLGRFWKVKGPGLIIVVPLIQQMIRIELRTVVLTIPEQDIISRDNISIRVSAVVYFRVIDPEIAVIQIEDYY